MAPERPSLTEGLVHRAGGLDSEREGGGPGMGWGLRGGAAQASGWMAGLVQPIANL